MGLKLFTFAYNTFLQESANQSSALFLPKVLASMKKGASPLLPLTKSLWKVGSLPDDYSQTFAITWFGPYFTNLEKESKTDPNAKKLYDSIISEKLTVIPCPGVGPKLELKELAVLGLANLKAKGGIPKDLTQSENGYECTIKLDFNAYPSTGEDWNQPTGLAGNADGTDSSSKKPFKGLQFTFSQCLCFAKRSDQTKCVPFPPGFKPNSSPDNANGFTNLAPGIAAIGITDAEIAAEAVISVDSDSNGLAVKINTLTFEGTSQALPNFALSDLEISLTKDNAAYVDVWAQFFKSIIETNEAQTSMRDAINSALKSSDNIKQVEGTLSDQLNEALNSILGKPSDKFSQTNTLQANVTNKVDQYIFDRATDALNNKDGKIYLPEVIVNVPSPVLEPYTTSELSIPGSYNTTFMGSVKLTVMDLKLPSGLTIRGLSNLIAPAGSIVFQNEETDGTFQLGRLPSGATFGTKKVPPPPLTAESTFSIMIQVGDNTPLGPYTGNINIAVTHGSDPVTPAAKTVLSSSGDDPQSLELTYSSINLDVSPSEIGVTITLDGQGGEIYGKAVSAVANQGALKTQIINAINGKINDDLPAINKAATKFARDQLKNLSGNL